MPKLYRLRDRLYRLVRPHNPGKDLGGSNGICIQGIRNNYLKVLPRSKLKLVEFKTPEEEELYTLLHEATHALFWDLDESVVVETSRQLTELLWALGYRLEQA